MKIFKLVALLVFVILLTQISLAQDQTIQLNEWYLPTADGTSELYIYEIGESGEPVVVLHGGFGSEHSYMKDAVKGLEDDFRFILYDQRGSLLSPAKPENISVEKHVEDLETLRKTLGQEKINIFAHSMGTLLAMHYLQKYPDRVKNLVLAAAIYPKAGKYLSPEEKALKDEIRERGPKFARRPKVVELFEKLDLNKKGKTPKEKTRLWKISFAAWNIYNIDRWREMKGGKAFYKGDAAKAASKSLAKDYNFVPALKNHKHPITVIYGNYDFLDFDNKLWKSILSDMKNVDLEIIQDSAHNIWVDRPEAFRNAVKKALEKKLKKL